MLVRPVILLVLLLCGAVLHAQTPAPLDTLRWQADHPLTRSDFKQEAQEYTGLDGEAFCMIFADYKQASALAKPVYHAVAVFERSKSWLGPEAKDQALIAYFQVMFDIYELHVRRMRKGFIDDPIKGDINAGLQQRYSSTMNAALEMFNEFRKDTRMGQAPEQVTAWGLRVRNDIRALEAYAR